MGEGLLLHQVGVLYCSFVALCAEGSEERQKEIMDASKISFVRLMKLSFAKTLRYQGYTSCEFS